MSGFFVDVEKAQRRGLIGNIKVSLNGKRLRNVFAAKSGKNGFAEFACSPISADSSGNIVKKKCRGNVKVSICK